MKEFKIGGKITLEDNKSYRILKMLRYKDTNYMFCCTCEKPIVPKIFEFVEEGR